MSSTKLQIILTNKFHPTVLKIIDDSAKHAGHAGVQGSTGSTHFSVLIVSDIFSGKSLVERHRLIYETLKDEWKASLHALAIQAFTPEEYQVRNL